MSDKVLIADDSDLARAELVGPFKAAGFEVIEAADGVQALEACKANQVDLVITDVHMPHMNGIEFCEALKGEASVPVKPPIIVVSTEANAEIKTRGKSAGVSGWVIKPIDGEKLVGVAKNLIAKYKAAS